MLFRFETLKRIADGSVTLAFRRWRRPSVKAGGTLKTAVGVLDIRSVDQVEADAINDEDACRAGFSTLTELLAVLDGPSDGDLYRIEFRLAGEDPRIALRNDDDLSNHDIDEIQKRLDRLDRASPRGPWTGTILDLIANSPGIRAVDLATSINRDRASFKRDVRKLKNLGLTESLEVGYRLSARGRALRRWNERQ